MTTPDRPDKISDEYRAAAEAALEAWNRVSADTAGMLFALRHAVAAVEPLVAARVRAQTAEEIAKDLLREVGILSGGIALAHAGVPEWRGHRAVGRWARENWTTPYAAGVPSAGPTDRPAQDDLDVSLPSQGRVVGTGTLRIQRTDQPEEKP